MIILHLRIISYKASDLVFMMMSVASVCFDVHRVQIVWERMRRGGGGARKDRRRQVESRAFGGELAIRINFT